MKIAGVSTPPTQPDELIKVSEGGHFGTPHQIKWFASRLLNDVVLLASEKEQNNDHKLRPDNCSLFK